MNNWVPGQRLDTAALIWKALLDGQKIDRGGGRWYAYWDGNKVMIDDGRPLGEVELQGDLSKDCWQIYVNPKEETPVGDKQERYFVVSESELEELVKTAVRRTKFSIDDNSRELFDAAEAACRAREVPEGTRFLDCFSTDVMEKLGSIMLWEIKRD